MFNYLLRLPHVKLFLHYLFFILVAQQQSPYNISQSTLEELTPESELSSNNLQLPQNQLFSQVPSTFQQAQLEDVATEKLESTIEETCVLENPGYLPHVIVIYLVRIF